jgi:hypothetical protein
MGLYVIEVPHTPEQCARSAREFETHPRGPETIEKTVWGCRVGGEHRSWTVAEFSDEHEARGLIPKELKAGAKIVPVEVFTFEQMLAAH